MPYFSRHMIAAASAPIPGWRRPALLAVLASALTLLALLLVAPVTHAANPQFAEQRFFGGPDDSLSLLSVGDLDGDGDLDMLADERIYLNDGSGNFPETRADVISPTEDLALADLNGDGYLDIATIGSFFTGSNRVVYLNDGHGRFAQRRNFGLGGNAIAIGDVDGDGDFDLVVGANGPETVFLNSGVGTFPVTRSFGPSEDGTAAIALGDLNGDGDLDLVAGNTSYFSQSCGCILPDQSRVYFNDGAGTFDQGHPLDIDATTLALGDLNGDGQLDIVAGGSDRSAIFLNGGAGAFSAGQQLGLANMQTSRLALGDLDHDGDMDIAVGNISKQNWVYLNDGAAGFSSAVSVGPGDDDTKGLAMADMNGDGHLDLVVGNDGQQSAVYMNNGSGYLPRSPKFADDSNQTFSTVVGDVDNDGDLDIVLGKISENVVFLNDGAGSFPAQHSFGEGMVAPHGLALGDIDGDGDLNDATGVFTDGQRVGEGQETNGVALGDVDGDGDLDLVLGNYGEQSYVYLNDGTGHFPIGRPFGTPDGATRSVALGDMDGDGDLDIVVCNSEFLDSNDGQSYVYLNDGVGNFPDRRPFSTPDGQASSVTVGDLDGDGDLDIVLGEYFAQNAIYVNDGDAHFATKRPFGTGAQSTESVALGDMDGDGDLDIVLGNGRSDQSLFYLNDGAGKLIGERTYSVPEDSIGKIALGDMDGDGDLDVVAGDGFADTFSPDDPSQNFIYLNGGVRPDPAPTITIARPGKTAQAGFFSTPEVLSGRVIPIDYTLFGHAGDTMRIISATYSLDGGGNWHPAVAAAGTVTNGLAMSPQGAVHIYNWDTFASELFGQSDNVVFRIIVASDVRPRAATIAGPFQRPWISATTVPFRVRGTQVRVFRTRAEPGNEAAGAVVYRLPRDRVRGAEPFANNTGEPYKTDGHGFLQGRGTLALSDTLVALWPAYITDTYTLYLTNATPTPEGLSAPHVTATGVQTLTVSPDRPLILFNLDVSLEWDARNDQPFMAQLRFDLQRASELLYDWSDGQAALGRVQIFHDREHWDTAHIRVYATNRLRPNANQGGIVAAPLTDPDRPNITYAPGQVRIGAGWNRYGDTGGSLGEDWPRTLAHELGHYALFLDDNYLGLNQAGRLISIPERPGDPPCPGAMSNPYREDYSEFHPTTGWLPACAQTLSQIATGRSDWATIKRFYDRDDLRVALNAPAAFDANPGPSTLPLVVTQISEPALQQPAETIGTPIFSLSQGGARAFSGPGARAFLFRREGDRLVDLGRPTLDQVTARGARPGDRLCVYDLDSARLGCNEAIRASDDRIDLVSKPGWQPEVIVTPVTSTTVSIEVRNIPGGLALKARLFSVDSDTAPIITLSEGVGLYAGFFSLTQPVFDGYVQIWVDESAPRREVVTDYTLGGNPGYRIGRNAPRGSPGYRIGRNAPASSGDGQVILFGDTLTFAAGQFFTVQAATSTPKSPSGRTVVGQSYWLRASQNAPDLRGASLSIGYLSQEAPAGEEDGIRIYYWNGAVWTPLPTDLDTERNLASAQVQGPGLYALMTSVELGLSGPGWNLISYPVRATRPVAEALASIDGVYTTVYGYNTADAADPWKIYDVSAPDWVNDLHTLEFGKGYWINATEAITLYLKGGAAPALAARAAASATATSIPTPPATYYGAVPGASPQATLTVQSWVGDTLCGQAQTAPHPIAGVLRNAYAINVRAAAGGADAGCGAPGRAVRLAFLDGTREVWSINTVWDNSHAIEIRPMTLYIPLAVIPARVSTDLAIVSVEVLPAVSRAAQPTEGV